MNRYVSYFLSEAQRLMPVFGLLLIALVSFYWKGTAIEAQFGQTDKSHSTGDSIAVNGVFDNSALAENEFSNVASFADFPPIFEPDRAVEKKFTTLNLGLKHSLKKGKINFGKAGAGLPAINFDGTNEFNLFSKDNRFRAVNLTR